MNSLTEYHKVSHLIRSCDTLLFRGDNLSSQVIMAFSGPWSHAALVIEMAGRLWVIEAVPPHVRIRSLPGLLSDYQGEVWWLRMKDGYSPAAKKLVEDYAISAAHQEIPYDLPGLIKYPFGPILVDGEEVLCSEFVQLAYHYGDFVTDLYVDTPTDIQEKYKFLEAPVMLSKTIYPEPMEMPQA